MCNISVQINPNYFGAKYSLIVFRVTKAVSNRDTLSLKQCYYGEAIGTFHIFFRVSSLPQDN